MISKVAIIGAGAIGGYCIWGCNNQCTVIAQGKRKENLQQNGIYINDIHYDLNVKDYTEAGKQDLVIICTKYNGLPDVISNLNYLIDENTIVLSLLNGVDSEDLIEEAIGANHVIHSVIRISSQRKGNHIYFDTNLIHDIYYGSLEKNDHRIERLNEYFSNTSIVYHDIDNILEDEWTKYASNIANNLPQAILQVPAAFYFEQYTSHGIFIATKLWNEVYQIAKAKGIHISETPILFNMVSLKAKFSTLQDIEAKRHTEIDMFLGVLLQYGKQLNMELPYSEYTYHLIKAFEEKNDGKFDV